MNIVVVMSDTLRTAYLGCYGNTDIRTPNIDRFAAQSAVFTEAYPESLPTIPERRALHTGRRAFPVRRLESLELEHLRLLEHLRRIRQVSSYSS